jgi:hypothetical protein
MSIEIRQTRPLKNEKISFSVSDIRMAKGMHQKPIIQKIANKRLMVVRLKL